MILRPESKHSQWSSSVRLHKTRRFGGWIWIWRDRRKCCFPGNVIFFLLPEQRRAGEMASSSTTKEGSESNSSKRREAPSFANFMLSAQIFQKPFLGVRPMKPNLNAAVAAAAAAKSVRQLHQSINSTADKCWRFLLLFATRNPILRNVLSLSSNLTRHFSEVQCRSFRNASSGHHNFAAILPGDSVAGVVVANGILNFLNIYNTLLIVRLVLTWFPNSPPAIVSPLSTLCDPYLNIFRGIIPPLGGTLDLSPILAFLVLNAFTSTAAALPAELPTSGSSQGIYTYPQTSAGLTTTSQEKWMRRLRGNKSNNSSSRTSRFSSYERIVAICLGLLAVISPLYIDRITLREPEEEEEPIDLASWLPLLLLVLILTIALCLCLDQSFTRFDPYWIHRVGGSSGGILIILLILALVLKFKSILNN